MRGPDTQSCTEMDALLAERASGPLDEGAARTLDRHLESCRRCRIAAEEWNAVFAHLALPPPKPDEEAALRDLPQRILLAWQAAQQRRGRVPMVALAGGFLAAAAVLLVLWHAPQWPARGPVAAPPSAWVAQSTAPAQLEWSDLPTSEMDEVDVSDTSTDDGALLDGLALEGDGAFSLGDSG